MPTNSRKDEKLWYTHATDNYNKKEWTSNMYNNLDVSQRRSDETKTPDTKEDTFCDSIYTC